MECLQAQYMKANLYDQYKQYSIAIQEYTKLLDNYTHNDDYPDRNRIALSKIRLGYCYRYLKDDAKAKTYFQDVITQYPNTKYSSVAKYELDRIEKELRKRRIELPSGRGVDRMRQFALTPRLSPARAR